MIKEEFVSLDTAKLLKKAGFPQYKSVTEYECCLKSTQAQAMRWLREENMLVIEPRPCWPYDGKTKCVIMKWCCVVLVLLECPTVEEQGTLINTLTYFPTYESAAEAGIQAACKYLIEKKKLKKMGTSYINYDMELPIPHTIEIVNYEGEPTPLSLTLFVDYDGRWHCGYRNWTEQAAMCDMVIQSRVITSCLAEALDGLKETLQLGGFIPKEKGGEE